MLLRIYRATSEIVPTKHQFASVPTCSLHQTKALAVHLAIASLHPPEQRLIWTSLQEPTILALFLAPPLDPPMALPMVLHMALPMALPIAVHMALHMAVHMAPPRTQLFMALWLPSSLHHPVHPMSHMPHVQLPPQISTCLTATTCEARYLNLYTLCVMLHSHFYYHSQSIMSWLVGSPYLIVPYQMLALYTCIMYMYLTCVLSCKYACSR